MNTDKYEPRMNTDKYKPRMNTARIPDNGSWTTEDISAIPGNDGFLAPNGGLWNWSAVAAPTFESSHAPTALADQQAQIRRARVEFSEIVRRISIRARWIDEAY